MLHVVKHPAHTIRPAAHETLAGDLAEFAGVLLLGVPVGERVLDGVLLAPEGLVAIVSAHARGKEGALLPSAHGEWLVDGQPVQLGHLSNPSVWVRESAIALHNQLGAEPDLKPFRPAAAVHVSENLRMDPEHLTLGDVLVASGPSLAWHLSELIARSARIRRRISRLKSAPLVGIVDVQAIAAVLGIGLELLPAERTLAEIGFGLGSAKHLHANAVDLSDTALRESARAETLEWEQKRVTWFDDQADLQTRVEAHLRHVLIHQFEINDATASATRDKLRVPLLASNYPLDLVLRANEHECVGAECDSPVAAHVEGDRPDSAPTPQPLPHEVGSATELREFLRASATSAERLEDRWVVSWPEDPLPNTDPVLRRTEERERAERTQRTLEAEKRAKRPKLLRWL